MKNSIYILFAICFITLSSCVNSGKGHKITDSKIQDTGTLKWQILNNGAQCAVAEAKQMLIKNAEEFNNIWQQTFQNAISPMPVMPAVDFTQNRIVVAYVGEVSTGGHEIKVQSVVQNKKSLVVTLKHLKPDSKCMVSQAVEYPYAFVLIEQVQTDNAKIIIVPETVSCD